MIKKSICLIAVMMFAAPAVAEPYQMTVQQAQDAAEALRGIAAGSKRTVKENERDHVVFEAFDLSEPVVNAIVRDTVRLEAAIRPHEEEIQALRRAKCPYPAACDVTEKMPAAEQKDHAEKLFALMDSIKTTKEATVTVDIIPIKIDELKPGVNKNIRTYLPALSVLEPR